MHGPAVVFPEPTETFVMKDNSIKYKAIELSEISGVYVKVIADYVDENEVAHKTGEELFITGKDQMIYYPRPEHALISYNGNNVYHAIAIPKGEGRYIMNRKTGEIRTVKGPSMFLPDPRNEVLVNRKLSKTECELWYPGNKDVLAYNVGVTDVEAAYGVTNACMNFMDDSVLAACDSALTASYATVKSAAPPTSKPSKSVYESSGFERKNNYTKPRSITFDNKYDGVVSLDIWTGYAVNVISKNGKREVVCGPQTIILDYDQTLEAMSLSTGTPKSNDRLMKTVYLRYKNNKVSDYIDAETSDFIPVRVKVSYDVDFDENAKDKWFTVDNYVKLLCDKIRSDVKRGVKNYTIQEFYNKYSDIVYELIMGNEKIRTFDDNGMILKDVNVMTIAIDAEIQDMLNKNQREMIRNMLTAQMDKANFERDKEKLALAIEVETIKYNNALEELELEKSRAEKKHEINLINEKFATAEEMTRLENERKQDELVSALATKKLEREKAEADQAAEIRDKQIEQDAAEKKAYAETVVSVMKSITPEMIAAMQYGNNAEILESVAGAIAPLAIAKNESLAETTNILLRGTGLEGVFDKLMANVSK
jgi:major vault protein